MKFFNRTAFRVVLKTGRKTLDIFKSVPGSDHRKSFRYRSFAKSDFLILVEDRCCLAFWRWPLQGSRVVRGVSRMTTLVRQTDGNAFSPSCCSLGA